MIRHIVMWKVKDENRKSENVSELRSILESLQIKIEQIIDLEVGVDIGKKGEVSADIVLNTTFKNDVDLEIYQNHPEHLKAVKLIRKLTFERRVVDYAF